MKATVSLTQLKLIAALIFLSLGVYLTFQTRPPQPQQPDSARETDQAPKELSAATAPSAQKKTPPLTAEEKQRLLRAEEAGDRFVQRWHKILDLDVLFDELYVSNVEQRRHNARLFYAAYKFITASGYDPTVAKEVDDSVMRAGFMAFWNMIYLQQEYIIAFRKGADMDIPPEVKEAVARLKTIKLDEKNITLAPVQEFIAKANEVSSALRKHFSPDVFNSPLYQANLRSHFEDTDASDIMRGFPDYGIGKNVEVYVIHRGIFDIYFVEEQGQFKVLTLRFEL